MLNARSVFEWKLTTNGQYVHNVKNEIDGHCDTGVMNHAIRNLESRRREM